MASLIENVVEPNRLLLTWQASDAAGNRTRWAVGQLERHEGRPTFRYFLANEFFELNGSTLAEIKALGFIQYPAFKPSGTSYADGVLEAFLRRLPPRNRSDFEDYKAHFRLAKEVVVSDFSLLAITEAKLPADGFALVDPFDETSKRREMMLEVAGHRYYAASCELANSVGEAVEFLPEPNNAHDKNAVVVQCRGQKIGYVNKFQSAAFLKWISASRVTGTVEKLNGEPGRPRVFIFVRVSEAAQSLAA